MKSPKSIFYIDGYNLYYGIRALDINRLKWLDIGKLACSLAAGSDIRCVKYFTAPVVRDADKLRRQKHYWEAVQTACQAHGVGLEIITGQYITKRKRCRGCRAHHETYEEKQTDVNIACHMVRDLYDDQFDRAYLITSDTDLLLPVRMCRDRRKEVISVFPPERGNTLFKHAATRYKLLKKKRLESCLLPNPVGRKLYIPPEWEK